MKDTHSIRAGIRAATQALQWCQDGLRLAHLQAAGCAHLPTNVTMESRSLHLHLHGLEWHCPVLATLYLEQPPEHPQPTVESVQACTNANVEQIIASVKQATGEC